MSDVLNNIDPRVKVTLNGVEINPSSVEVDKHNKPSKSGEVSLFLDKSMLLHELREMGVAVEASSLLEFVKRDIKEHPKQSICGYFGILQSVASPPLKRSFLQKLMRKEEQAGYAVDVFLNEAVDAVEESGFIVIRASVC